MKVVFRMVLPGDGEPIAGAEEVWPELVVGVEDLVMGLEGFSTTESVYSSIISVNGE